jgi:hypothetical protein
METHRQQEHEWSLCELQASSGGHSQARFLPARR